MGVLATPGCIRESTSIWTGSGKTLAKGVTALNELVNNAYVLKFYSTLTNYLYIFYKNKILRGNTCRKENKTNKLNDACECNFIQFSK